jgi:hypothetical protein
MVDSKSVRDFSRRIFLSKFSPQESPLGNPSPSHGTDKYCGDFFYRGQYEEGEVRGGAYGNVS